MVLTDLLWEYEGATTASIELFEYVIVEHNPKEVSFTDPAGGVDVFGCEPTFDLYIETQKDDVFTLYSDYVSDTGQVPLVSVEAGNMIQISDDGDSSFSLNEETWKMRLTATADGFE